MEATLVENISFKTVCKIANLSLITNSMDLQKRCKAFLVACHRSDRIVEDLDLLDDGFLVQILKSSKYDVIATV